MGEKKKIEGGMDGWMKDAWIRVRDGGWEGGGLKRWEGGGGRKGGREGGSKDGRWDIRWKGGKEELRAQKMGGREVGREESREGGKEGGRKGGRRKDGTEGGRDGGREGTQCVHEQVIEKIKRLKGCLHHIENWVGTHQKIGPDRTHFVKKQSNKHRVIGTYGPV